MKPPNLELFATPGSSSGCGSCGKGDDGSRCGNGLEKIYPTTAVRFGYMRFIGEFSHSPEMKFTCGAKTVISTTRGIEIGEQVSLSCSGCDKSVTRDQMKDWVKTSGEDAFIFEAGRILREATAGDLAEYAHIQEGCREKRRVAEEIAARHKLPMTIVECEHLFGGERIVFYFTADERVDFRGMVKDLAREYRTRIEMRQIGARDEARLLADFETCGREVCCKVFLKTLKPISMRMAKLQKATLDPSQVSGRCGRLKCCLRYEHESYDDLDKRLPNVGTRIATNHGDGVVVNRQILTQLLQIRKDDDSLVTVVIEDVTATNVARKAEKRSSDNDGRSGDGDKASGRQQRGRGGQRRRPRKPGQGDEPSEKRESQPSSDEKPGTDSSGENQPKPEAGQEGESGSSDSRGDGSRSSRGRGRRKRPRRRGDGRGDGRGRGGPRNDDSGKGGESEA